MTSKRLSTSPEKYRLWHTLFRRMVLMRVHLHQIFGVLLCRLPGTEE